VKKIETGAPGSELSLVKRVAGDGKGKSAAAGHGQQMKSWKKKDMT